MRGSRGGPRGPWPPPPTHKILLPQIVRRGPRGPWPPRGPRGPWPPPPYKILDPPMIKYIVSKTCTLVFIWSCGLKASIRGDFIVTWVRLPWTTQCGPYSQRPWALVTGLVPLSVYGSLNGERIKLSLTLPFHPTLRVSTFHFAL